MERKLSKAHNKKTGITYVYEVLENHWDPELKQPRNKRRLIGRLDPVTNEVVPTGKKGPQKRPDSDEVEKLKKEYQVKFLEAQKNSSNLEEEIRSLRNAIRQFAVAHQAHLNAINVQLQAEETELSTLLNTVDQLMSIPDSNG